MARWAACLVTEVMTLPGTGLLEPTCTCAGQAAASSEEIGCQPLLSQAKTEARPQSLVAVSHAGRPLSEVWAFLQTARSFRGRHLSSLKEGVE